MQNDLKKRIMRRVYGIWFVRRVLPPASALGFFAFLALRETAEKFFVAQVVSNFLAVTASNIWAAPQFLGVAVRNAEPTTLFIISFSILATFVVSVQLLRSIRMIIGSRNQMFFRSVILK